MEYDRIEQDTIYRNACENLKKIANAIKAIRIKYYPNFSQISVEDQKVYDELQSKMTQISSEHGLDKLKIELITEINKKYERQNEGESDNQTGKSEDDILMACYGAIDAEATALAHGRLGKARNCQKVLEEYMAIPLDGKVMERIIQYKREKFAEISQTKDNIQTQNTSWISMLRGFNEKTSISKKQEVIQEFGELRNKEQTNSIEIEEQEELVY